VTRLIAICYLLIAFDGQVIESYVFAKSKGAKEPAPSAAEGMGHPAVS
jgi:hypothetical protein